MWQIVATCWAVPEMLQSHHAIIGTSQSILANAVWLLCHLQWLHLAKVHEDGLDGFDEKLVEIFERGEVDDHQSRRRLSGLVFWAASMPPNRLAKTFDRVSRSSFSLMLHHQFASKLVLAVAHQQESRIFTFLTTIFINGHHHRHRIVSHHIASHNVASHRIALCHLPDHHHQYSETTLTVQPGAVACTNVSLVYKHFGLGSSELVHFCFQPVLRITSNWS